MCRVDDWNPDRGFHLPDREARENDLLKGRSAPPVILSPPRQFTRVHVWRLQNTLITQPETSSAFGPVSRSEPE